MYIVDRSIRLIRGFLLSYGPSNLKKRLWDKEYISDKWHFADNTIGDPVYGPLEKYSRHGRVLDMGCGSGNTATEMAGNVYDQYIGVDISQAALDKAADRSKACGRGDKNSFECADILSYVPSGTFDVILFRESLYHVPMNKIKATLDRYSQCLKPGGVGIVRLFAGDRQTGKVKERPSAMLQIVASEFDVLEKTEDTDLGKSTVIVFRPKATTASEVVASRQEHRVSPAMSGR